MTIKLDRDTFNAWYGAMDEEAKIEISTTIMNEFAKKYLKPLENDSGIKKTINTTIEKYDRLIQESLTKEIESAIGTLKKEKFGYGQTIEKLELNPEFKKRLDKEIESKALIYKNQMITEADKLFIEKSKELENRFNEMIDRRIDAMEARLEQKMKGHFQVLLNRYLTLGIEN